MSKLTVLMISLQFIVLCFEGNFLRKTGISQALFFSLPIFFFLVSLCPNSLFYNFIAIYCFVFFFIDMVCQDSTGQEEGQGCRRGRRGRQREEGKEGKERQERKEGEEEEVIGAFSSTLSYRLQSHYTPHG